MGNAKRKVKRGTIAVLMIFLLGIPAIIYGETPEDLQKAKEREAFRKGSALYFYQIGNDYQNKGDIAQAITSWSKAIESNADFVEAYYNRGNAYARQNMFDLALADMNKVIEMSPEGKLKAQAYYNRGLIFDKKNQIDQAIADYTKTIEINPEYAPAYKNRAVGYFSKKEYDKSWADVNKSESLGLKVHPQFLELLRKSSMRNK